MRFWNNSRKENGTLVRIVVALGRKFLKVVICGRSGSVDCPVGVR
jgi:hypothetical protein